MGYNAGASPHTSVTHTRRCHLPAEIRIRRARTSDVRTIRTLIDPLVGRGVLLAKETVQLYEDVQEFWVAERAGAVVGCGAVHVIWEDLAEVRTLVVDDGVRGQGVGGGLLRRLLATAAELGVRRVFTLTFEVGFFRRHGFEPIGEAPGVGPRSTPSSCARSTSGSPSSSTSSGSSRTRSATPAC
jgi:amino-acid N-acetyltransferase